ncbi:MAG: FecR family protein [Magnetovibrionaceae bacterium]
MSIVGLIALPAGAEEAIGQVKTVTGTVSAVHNGTEAPLAAGADIFQNVTLKTGSDGAVGVTFIDNTTLSMGESSEMVIDEMIFDPAAGNMSFSAKLAEGTFAFVTGSIAKLKPENMSISSPVATIGIRGTRFVVRIDNSDAEGGQ